MRPRLVLSTCSLVRLTMVAVLAGLLTNSTTFAQQDVAQQSVIEEIAACDCGSSDLARPDSQSVTIKNCVSSESICIAPQDEVWFVSTRRCCADATTVTEFHTRQILEGQWQSKSVADLASCHQSDPDHITVVVIHGNNTTERWALTRGMQFYERVFGQVPSDRPAIRMVLLAWESEKVLPRPGPDYQLKSARAAALGSKVASLLNELGGSRPVLVGYSLGVQVVLSTLSELAATEGADLSECAQGFQVAMVAPALDADFARHGLATIPYNPLIEDAEIFINRHDRVALAARVLNRKRGDDGTVESSVIELADHGRFDFRFHMHDVTREVRNRHSLVNYVQSATVRCCIREMVVRAATQHAEFLAEGAGDGPRTADADVTDTVSSVPQKTEPIQR